MEAITYLPSSCVLIFDNFPGGELKFYGMYDSQETEKFIVGKIYDFNDDIIGIKLKAECTSKDETAFHFEIINGTNQSDGLYFKED